MRLLAYFRNVAEALHLAYETAPHHWVALNANEPVLPIAKGQPTVRDPFIYQTPDGRFHLLGTHGRGKDCMQYAASDDLIHWSALTLVPIMGAIDGTWNVWAPECFYDRHAQAIRLIWSSTVKPGIDRQTARAQGRGGWDHRIWSCTTNDFASYSKLELWFDPGYNVIDATVLVRPDGDYMVFKDERGENQPGTPHKRLRTTIRPLGAATFGPVSDEFTDERVEGPVLLYEDGLYVVYMDHFMADHWSALASRDFVTWHPYPDVAFPETPSHGAVFEVEDAIGHKVIEHFSRQS